MDYLLINVSFVEFSINIKCALLYKNYYNSDTYNINYINQYLLILFNVF
jgi:hypothetical protein